VSSGSVEQTPGASSSSGSPKLDLKLQGGGQGLLNPLAWDNIPTKLKQQFPHWKENNPLTASTSESQTSLEGTWG